MDVVRGGRIRTAIAVGLVVSALARPSGAISKTPYLSVEVEPLPAWAGETISIVVRTWADPEWTVPGQDDEWARSFGEASPTLDNVLVARAEGAADVPVELSRVDVDEFEGTILLPAGEWRLELFPGRIGWASPSLPPGYSETIRIRVIDPAAIPGLADCPVTQPVTAPATFADRLFGGGTSVGNRDLWVGALGRDGVMVAEPWMVAPDGSIGWKLGWWRLTPGKVTISARRLDGDAAPLRAAVPDGYGFLGFQASGVHFPMEGCWEVTGTTGGAPLTFVTFVTVR
jgi:hypothetical protein